MTESAPGASVLYSKFSGGGFKGGTQGAGGIFFALLALRRLQDGQRSLQDCSKTRLRQSKTDPRWPKAPPRLSRWLQGASQTAQGGPKIDETPRKNDKGHPHLGFIFIPPKHPHVTPDAPMTLPKAPHIWLCVDNQLPTN